MNRDQLLAIRSVKVEKAKISGIGEIGLRVLSARDALDLDDKLKQANGSISSMVAIQLAAFVCDDNGVPILSQEDAVQLLDKLSARQLRELIAHGSRLNALGEASVEDAGGN